MLNNTITFFDELQSIRYSKQQILLSKANSLSEIDISIKKLNSSDERIELSQMLYEEINNIREKVINTNLVILEDFENTLKKQILKEYYGKIKKDLTHIEQVIILHYLIESKKITNLSNFSKTHEVFFSIFSALMNKNKKNTEKYLYDIKSIKRISKYLENVKEFFEESNFNEGLILIEEDLSKLKKNKEE